MASFVKFIRCTKSAFDKLHSKDSNSLYFVEDVGEFYKGNTSFTGGVIQTEEVPESPTKGKIYYVKSEKVAKFWDGSQWILLNGTTSSAKIEVDNELSDEKSTKNAVSGDAIKTYIDTKLKTISSEGVKADIKVQDAVEDELVKTDSSGNVKCAGVKVGLGTLNEHPDSKTLATEAAVNAVKEELSKSKIDISNITKKISEDEPSDDKVVSEKALVEYLSWTELEG